MLWLSLVGAYQAAPLEFLLAAYERMKSWDIPANEVFAEVYLTRVPQIPKDKNRRRRMAADIAEDIRVLPAARAQAARAALADFRQGGVKLSNLCQAIDAAFKLL